MEKPVFVLVYTSRSSEPISPKVFREILERSRHNNARDGITGMLTARSNYFLQLLEGHEDKVRACFERIQADRRHTQVMIRGEAFAETRLFPDWSMAWVDSRKATEEFLALFESARTGGQATRPADLYAMLRQFSEGVSLVA